MCMYVGLSLCGFVLGESGVGWWVLRFQTLQGTPGNSRQFGCNISRLLRWLQDGPRPTGSTCDALSAHLGVREGEFADGTRAKMGTQRRPLPPLVSNENLEGHKQHRPYLCSCPPAGVSTDNPDPPSPWEQGGPVCTAALARAYQRPSTEQPTPAYTPHQCPPPWRHTAPAARSHTECTGPARRKQQGSEARAGLCAPSRQEKGGPN